MSAEISREQSPEERQLIVYGVPFSQPVRAVLWLLLLKRRPFELRMVNPGSKGDSGSRHPDFLAKNPGGTIPTLQEPETGFTLGEAHAIMPYLCSLHGWDDVYPADLHLRARVDWYLHYHHRNVRDASLGLVAPKIRKDLNIPELMQQMAQRNLKRALAALESWWLQDSRYLVADHVTIADLAAYVEIGQLQACFTNVYEFSDFPKVEGWLETMKQVPEHDVVHTVLSELGDISEEAPPMELIRDSNINALRALKARVADFGA